MGCCNSSPANGSGDIPDIQPYALEKKSLKGRYVLTDVLGEGASCTVVKGRHKETGRVYAVKLLVAPADKSDDDAFLAKTEASILSHVRDPNVVGFSEGFRTDVWLRRSEAENFPAFLRKDETASEKPPANADNRVRRNIYVIVTQWCAGGELFDRIKKGLFSERVASRMIRQMLCSVKACHDRNVSHRDLKPENFVFETKDDNSRMKLIDFGCAVAASPQTIIPDVAGSPYYVAPEVLNRDLRRTLKMWKASDMWSIGVIAFLLTHGRPPFNGENNQAIFSRIVKGKYRVEPKRSSALRDFIKKLLKLNPNDRMAVDEALSHEWIARVEEVDNTALSAKVINAINAFEHQCKLKKAMAHLVVNRMTARDHKVMETIFSKYDTNNDGHLDASEIAAMMNDIGSDMDAKAFLAAADEDGDNKVDVDEFKVAYAAQTQMNDENELRDMFESIDLDNSGSITVDELRGFFTNHTKEQVEEMLEGVDKDNNGEIDFNEWMQAMHNNKQLATIGGAQRKDI
jgi:calcium-dependent protein kinase